MNKSSINYFNHKQICHILAVWCTFCIGLNLLLQMVFEQPVNPVNGTFATTNSFWNHFFPLATKVIWEREKKGRINKLISLMLWWTSLPAKWNLWKMAKKSGRFLATHENVTMLMGRDRNIQTILRTNQIYRALGEKNNQHYVLLDGYHHSGSLWLFGSFQANLQS